MIDREDNEILRFDLRGVRLVCNGQRTTTKVIDPVGMELPSGLAGTRIVRIIEVTGVTTGSTGVVGRRAFVTGYLEVNRISNRQLHDIFRVRRMIDVTVLPVFQNDGWVRLKNAERYSRTTSS